ncbi:MAG: hypothetical protein Q4G68_00730 [Planctomycetia bacterium]|nr:hypothetical protein [Planctomycetia bacterium]
MSALSLSKNKKVKEPKAPKPKKEKKIKAAKQTKSASGKTGVAKKKIPADKYTLILLLAWLILIAACVMMYLDLISYQQ